MVDACKNLLSSCLQVRYPSPSITLNFHVVRLLWMGSFTGKISITLLDTSTCILPLNACELRRRVHQCIYYLPPPTISHSAEAHTKHSYLTYHTQHFSWYKQPPSSSAGSSSVASSTTGPRSKRGPIVRPATLMLALVTKVIIRRHRRRLHHSRLIIHKLKHYKKTILTYRPLENPSFDP